MFFTYLVFVYLFIYLLTYLVTYFILSIYLFADSLVFGI
jgi:hypothetical protein